MTDSEQKNGGLPTAAYRWRDHVGVEQVSINSPKEPMHEFNERFGADELVRRSDVKALIQEAVEHELEKVRDSLLMVTDKGGGTDRYRERLQEGLTYRMENLDVEELLEELEQ